MSRVPVLGAALLALTPVAALAGEAPIAHALLTLSVEGGPRPDPTRVTLLVTLENIGSKELWVNSRLAPSPGHARGPLSVELTDSSGKSVEVDCTRRAAPRAAYKRVPRKGRLRERFMLRTCAFPPLPAGTYRARAVYQEPSAPARPAPPAPKDAVTLAWALVSNEVNVTIAAHR